MALATFGSLLPGNAWYIRMLDFVIEVLLYLSLACALLSLLAGNWRKGLLGGFIVLSAVQLLRIWPYVVIAPNDFALAATKNSECISVLQLNVLQDNRDYERTLDLLRERDPDLLLLTETDQAWLDALMPVLERYPQRLAQPLDNTYGMIFATRLPVQRAAMPTDRIAGLPTLYATVTIPGAGDFELIGIHPRPPKPGQDTDKRDRMIIDAGIATPDGLEEALTLGDFNDVPWSRTTRLFREEGNYSDPRAGRGTYPTFPAKAGKLGWPLDHIYVKGGLVVSSFEVLDDVGSDHLPLAASVCLDPMVED